VIAPIGYGPEGLDEGRTLLTTWLEHRKLAQALMRVQTQSTGGTQNAARADTKQKEAIQAQRAQQATAKTAEITLRKWYWDARKLIGLAIDEVAPKGQDQLRELLGLND